MLIVIACYAYVLSLCHIYLGSAHAIYQSTPQSITKRLWLWWYAWFTAFVIHEIYIPAALSHCWCKIVKINWFGSFINFLLILSQLPQCLKSSHFITMHSFFDEMCGFIKYTSLMILYALVNYYRFNYILYLITIAHDRC